MAADVETAVIGAGVVGLAIGRALALAGHRVLVLERHGRIGTETSARNSEVIHAGLYYPPGSLRAELCVSGKALLYRFCEENGVAHLKCGKLLVAADPSETAKLEIDRRQRRGKWRTRAKIVGRGGARARAGARLRRGLPLPLHRRHRHRRPDDRARGPPDDARRRGGAERSRDAHRGSSRCGRRFHARDCQRRRDERPDRAQRRDRGGLRRH